MCSMASNRLWQCPFYRYDQYRDLRCEAGQLKFQRRKTHRRYVERYCASAEGWEACTLAKALLEQYEEGEHGD